MPVTGNRCLFLQATQTLLPQARPPGERTSLIGCDSDLYWSRVSCSGENWASTRSGQAGRRRMASVYWARDPRIGRDVAIRSSLPGAATTRPPRPVPARGPAAGHLSHPTSSRSSTSEKVDEFVYYASCLRRAARRPDRDLRRVPYRQALLVSQNIASRWTASTRQDLPPGYQAHNILKADSGEYKLADFGLGKSRIRYDHTCREMIGTLRYLPPRARGGSRWTTRATCSSLVSCSADRRRRDRTAARRGGDPQGVRQGDADLTLEGYRTSPIRSTTSSSTSSR